ncbi:MAG: SlyX family protein [Gammaproteobacteria bacterium]|nr:SlyX family protein [Gammaproteobacteria bacterium]
MSLEQRINDLECQIAFQDDTIEKLNQTVIEQNEQIQMLLKHYHKLHAQVITLQEDSSSQNNGQILDEKPPHY